MSADPVRVGMLSAAHLHAGAYASVLRSLDGAELVGVVDEYDDRGREFAETHGTDFLDAESLLERADGVVVCSTNVRHRNWIERASATGVDVLSEKPLSPAAEDARAIVDTCRDADVHLGVAMPLRFSLPARRAKAALEDGTIGSLRAISGTNRGQLPGGWFVDPDATGGGAVMDHTVHIVDLVHWLTGDRVAEVYAETGTRFHDISVEDVNVLSMTLEDGTQFSLDGSWSRPDEWDFWGDATVSLVGTDATVDVDCFAQKLTHTDDSDESDGIQSLYWGSDPNAGLVADFVEAIRADRAPETTGAEGVAAVAVVEAAYESAERGEPVDVAY
ncbi:Gfo/Idh/MocA family protein [Natronorubrum halophilum]|uniref:Gfo/Idh/MocA family protein n=1 Tax=Natronorubrum halophilum TaxID=1702106 RepID=UPI000EF7548B|nr:Gfo/Idh/MocA family oxidoreductase [Natronorubrum halophilum]